jgi:hypothetical protein
MNKDGQIEQHHTGGCCRTIVYKYDQPGESLYDTPTVYFCSDFINRPSFDWTIDFSGSDCYWVRCGNACHERCMIGVLVKSPDPPRVWRLTGEIDPNREGLNYQGRWPD